MNAGKSSARSGDALYIKSRNHIAAGAGDLADQLVLPSCQLLIVHSPLRCPFDDDSNLGHKNHEDDSEHSTSL